MLVGDSNDCLYTSIKPHLPTNLMHNLILWDILLSKEGAIKTIHLLCCWAYRNNNCSLKTFTFSQFTILHRPSSIRGSRTVLSGSKPTHVPIQKLLFTLKSTPWLKSIVTQMLLMNEVKSADMKRHIWSSYYISVHLFTRMH